MATASEWIAGARPRTLSAAVAPVAAGFGVTLWAGSSLSTGLMVVNALLALLVAILLQIGVNYFNDYHDGIRGTDEVRVGPVRLVGQGLAEPAAVKRAALISLGAAAGIGVLLIVLSGEWIMLPIGAVALIAAWGYTGGSRPYGYYGLGEVFVFIFFGPVAVCGTTLVTGGPVWPVAAVASIAIGLLAVAILITNNLRDAENDAQVGKHTLAVRLGDSRTRQAFAGCLIAAFVLVAWVALLSTPWAALGLLGAIPGVKAAQEVLEHAYGAGLIPVLQATSLALLVTGVGLGVGLAL